MLLTAREVCRIMSAFFRKADSREQSFSLLDAFRAVTFLHTHGPFDQIIENCRMRPQVEVLKHHAELRPDAVHLAAVTRLKLASPAAAAALKSGFTHLGTCTGLPRPFRGRTIGYFAPQIPDRSSRGEPAPRPKEYHTPSILQGEGQFNP